MFIISICIINRIIKKRKNFPSSIAYRSRVTFRYDNKTFREYNDLESEIQLLPSHNRLVWDNRFEIINNTNVSVKILPLGSILNNSFYKKNFKINKKKIKTIPFQVRKTLPAIFTLEGLLYVPHLNIYELNSLKVSIEVETIDFFDKKYDNII